MAFKPSARRSKDKPEQEADMLPIMGLIIILIPMLLSSAQFARLGMIELNLPKAAGGGGGGAPKEPKEVELKLNLSVTILKNGFTIASAGGVAGGGSEAGQPTIPLKGAEHDFEALTKYLFDLKEKAESSDNNYVDLGALTLVAEKDIPYKTVVGAMDASRIYKEDSGKKHILFPSVSIAAGIL